MLWVGKDKMILYVYLPFIYLVFIGEIRLIYIDISEFEFLKPLVRLPFS